MKTLDITIRDHYSSIQRTTGLRTTMIILRLLDDAENIEAWATGRAEIHWKDDSVKMHITKVDSA